MLVMPTAARTGAMPTTRGARSVHDAPCVADSTAARRHHLTSASLGSVRGMLSMGQQDWSAPSGAAREIRALQRIHSPGSMGSAQSITAKFTHGATNGILPTQGCSIRARKG